MRPPATLLPPGPLRRALAAALLLLLAACGGGGGGTVGGGGGNGGGAGIPPSPDFAVERQHNLDELNRFRAMVGAAPLRLDDRLSTYAEAGSRRLMADHSPHAHFNSTPCPYPGACAENQGDPNGWPPRSSVIAQIDEILRAMWNEGPGSGPAHGHYNNMVDTRWTRLGVGLVLDGSGRLYFTNDFQ